MEFKLLCDAAFPICETPVWDSRLSVLYYTDLAGGRICRFDPETMETRVFNTHQTLGGVCLCDDSSKVLCALASGMFVLDQNTGKLDFIVNPEKRPGYQFNDTRVDPAGRIFTSTVTKYFGTEKQTPDMLGAFYMIDTDLSVTTLAEGIVQYNGICWNKDLTKMYVIATENALLLSFDYSYEKGAFGSAHTELQLSEYGMPDGLSIDSEDNLYISHWDKKITVWNKDLALKETIEAPTPQVCCTGNGGTDGKTLFVATGSYGYTEADFKEFPGAGGIFTATVEVGCKEENYFKIQ